MLVAGSPSTAHGAPQEGRSRRAGRRATASANTRALTAAGALDARRCGSRSCGFAPRRCRKRCRWALARWRRSSALRTTTCAVPATTAAEGGGRRGGQLQRAVADRDRRPQGRGRTACDAAKRLGAKRALLLPVSAPFHSPLMQPAGRASARSSCTAPICRLRIPLINNVDVAIESDPARIVDALAARPTAGALGRRSCRRSRSTASRTSSNAGRAGCWPAWRSASRRISNALAISTARA